MTSKNSLSDRKSARHGEVSRREFARRTAMATAAAAAWPGVLLTEAAATAPGTTHLEQTASVTPLSPSSQAEVDMRFHAILSKYGSRLNDEQKSDVRRLAAETQKNLDKLRAYALDNSEQPATVLKPLMERPARPAGQPASAPAQKPKT
jgi:hypothetical protein